MLVFITVKSTSSNAVVFQSQKRVQYYLPALEIRSITSFPKPKESVVLSSSFGTTWHINEGSLEYINKKHCILIKVWCNSSLPEQNQGYARVETFRFSRRNFFNIYIRIIYRVTVSHYMQQSVCNFLYFFVLTISVRNTLLLLSKTMTKVKMQFAGTVWSDAHLKNLIN